MENQNKTLILATFVKKSDTEIFLNYINNEFGLLDSDLFIYDIIEETHHRLLTYKLLIGIGERVEIKKIPGFTITTHK